MTEKILLLFTNFIIYSFFGWVLESVFKTILAKKWVNSGFLMGPFCPIYGFGAIIMTLLNRFKSNIFITFIAGIIVLSIWEYLVGVLLEKFFKTTYWDYSDKPFNIKGRVCLENSMYWGILAVIFIYLIEPRINKLILLPESNILIYVNILIYAYLLTDFIISIVKTKNIEIKIQKISDIGEKLKEKLEELEQAKDTKKKELLDTMITKLKEDEERIKRKLYRHILRLEKAFPTMKSTIINRIIKERKEEIKNRR